MIEKPGFTETMKYYYLVLLLFLLAITACAGTSVKRADNSERALYNGVSLKPGAVTWSPDSSRLAVIKDGSLIIHSIETDDSKRISGVSPIFLDWSPGDDLLVIGKAEDQRQLFMVNPDDGTALPVSGKDQFIAAKYLYPPDTSIVLSKDTRRFSIGTFVTYRLLKISGMGEEEFFSREVYFPTSRKDRDTETGWTYPGIRPIHETVLTPVFHDPPAAAPYMNIKTVDPSTQIETSVVKLMTGRFNAPASWSPDGSRLAVTDDGGFLMIIDLESPQDVNPVNHEIQGRFPAWNPKGSQIYLGGWLVQSDGSIVRQLLSNGFDSLGVWSPDGTKLAVISDKWVTLFGLFSPAFISPDRPVDLDMIRVRGRLRLLKDLLREGLVSPEEFSLRKAKLLLEGER